MFLNRNKKNNLYPCKPQFYYIKVGFQGVKIIKVCFRDDLGELSLPSCICTRAIESLFQWSCFIEKIVHED